MVKTLVVANWKQNKTLTEAYGWLSEIKLPETTEKEFVLCPGFTLLYPLYEKIKTLGLPTALGSQDFPAFPDGAHTGEEPLEILKELTKYAIIGHSERKKYAHETEEDVILKLKLSLESNITPILCLSDLNQLDYYLMHGKEVFEPSEKIVFVYEPPNAISGGGEFRPENPEEVNQKASEISSKIGKRVHVLYGGSINPDNAGSFFSLSNIDGGLVGQASLDASSFSNICAQ